MLIEAKPGKDSFGVRLEHFGRSAAFVEQLENRDQSAHDKGVAIGPDPDGARSGRVGLHLHPDHGLAAVDAVRFGFFGFGQSGELLPQIDEIGVTLFPIGKPLEVGDDFVERHDACWARPLVCSSRSQSNRSSSSRNASCLTRSMISPAKA